MTYREPVRYLLPREFKAMPTVKSQFPLVYKTGARWTEITLTCRLCDAVLTDDQVRGHVFHHLREDAFELDFVTDCSDCRVKGETAYGIERIVLSSDTSMKKMVRGAWVSTQATSPKKSPRLAHSFWRLVSCRGLYPEKAALLYLITTMMIIVVKVIYVSQIH